jgi:hypothetical protein
MPLNEIRRRLKRSKQSERDLGHWLLKFDGPDPRMKGITSSTGRVGHITQLQYDVASMTYAAENKHIKLPVKWLQWWLQIIDIARANGKEALLRIEPSNLPLGSRKTIPEMHIITAERHAELLKSERNEAKLWDFVSDLPVGIEDLGLDLE